MSRKLIGATLTAGDATAQLMWRLQNGEAPANLAALRAAFVLIGSNDPDLRLIPGERTPLR